MADIYLGQSGSEVKLPKIRSFGSLPKIPVGRTLAFEKEPMGDGSFDYNVLEQSPRTWIFVFENLTDAEIAPLRTENARGEALHFQNNWESSAWTWVFIEGFDEEVDLEVSTDADVRWRLTLKLGEAPAAL